MKKYKRILSIITLTTLSLISLHAMNFKNPLETKKESFFKLKITQREKTFLGILNSLYTRCNNKYLYDHIHYKYSCENYNEQDISNIYPEAQNKWATLKTRIPFNLAAEIVRNIFTRKCKTVKSLLKEIPDSTEPTDYLYFTRSCKKLYNPGFCITYCLCYLDPREREMIIDLNSLFSEEISTAKNYLKKVKLS